MGYTLRHSAWYAGEAGSLGTFLIIETYFNSLTRQGTVRGYYPEPSKSIQRISRLKICLEHVTYLRFAWAQFILGVTLGATSPIAIGWESVCWYGRRTLAWSSNPQVNIPRIVMQQWHAWSNRSGYFCSALPGTLGVSLREWIRCFGKPFCLVLSS